MDWVSDPNKEEKKKLFLSVFSAISNVREGNLEALKEIIPQYPWLVNTARDEVTIVY